MFGTASSEEVGCNLIALLEEGRKEGEKGKERKGRKEGRKGKELNI
jgi:hypothetical protein